MKKNKYQGIFPAFYACYDSKGEISPTAIEVLCSHLADTGIKGVYVGGSSGECIYHSVSERKLVLETVVKCLKGKLTIIAHVACNNTKDSMELAAHAKSLGVDAIAAIPPIYFKLPDRSIEKYWNDISSAAEGVDFFIYNIPQLAGVALNSGLLSRMMQNKNVIGVKNSSDAVKDIEKWRDEGALVFNGPDSQLLSGLSAGAIGGIGGTYGAMPCLYVKIYELFKVHRMEEALEIQDACRHVSGMLSSGQGHMYAVIKGVLKARCGVDIGGVRDPLYNLTKKDEDLVKKCAETIESLYAKYL